MSFENETPDLSGLVSTTPTETPEQARERLLTEVMTSQQALAGQFSKIDHPYSTDDAKDDYVLATEEFKGLIRRVIHLPDSVEGIRYLERWHANRMEQVELLLAHAKPGNQLVLGAGTEPVAISEDFAKGMRAGLLVVRQLLDKFPLQMTVTDGFEDEDEDDPGH